MIRKKMTSLVGIVVLASAAMYAQTSTGSLSGTITDPNGATIPGAKVVATSLATGVKQEIATTDAGLYVFATLPVATYTITVEKAGFKKLSRTNIEIRIAQRLDLNLRLELGDVQQTVEVTADAPLLETSTPERGQNVSQKLMDNLPLFSGGIRSPGAFVNYMPGVTNNGEQSVSGSGGRAQEILLDGASALNNESSVAFLPSSEMFSEFKMLQSNYSAEYGRVGGGIQIYSAKSGTNWFHGAAFHNMRRDIWNANAWARNANPNPAANFRPKERFNETGGVIGGPAYIPKVYDGRNKTFFFFTYDKDIRPATLGFPVMTVPTALMKTGAFTEAGVPTIYDPATTAGDVRQPFPNNTIPAARFSRGARNLMPLIPNPTQNRLAGNYDFVNTSVYERRVYSWKVDHAFSATNRFSYFWSNEIQAQDDVSGFAGAIGNGLKNAQDPYNHRLNHDYSIRPNLLMHTTFGNSRTRQKWTNPNQNGAGSKLGFALTGDSDATPRIQFSGAAGLSPYGVQDGKVANGLQFNWQYSIAQGYTWLRGKHEYKFGWAYRKFATRGEDLAGTNGLYLFNRAQTALPTALTSTGHEFASLILGGADRASQIVPPVLFETTWYHDSSGYFQDNWRVTSKLTLNLGFRYEVPIGWHRNGIGYSHIDLKTPNPAAGGIPGALVFSGTGPGRTGNQRFFPTDWSNIGPRLGFAYLATPKTVIRGGWAIYYQGLSSGGCGCTAGFAGSNDLQSDGRSAVLNWDNGIPLAPGYQPPPIMNPSYVNFQSVQSQLSTFGQAGRIQNASIDIQHEFKGFLFDVAYQRNRGTRLASTTDLNQLPVGQLSKGSLLAARIDSPAAAAAGIRAPFASFPASQSVAQSLRAFPQYLTVAGLGAAFGHSWYDALQTKVERRFGTYQLMVNYTWSKNLGYGHYRQVFSQIGSPGATPQDFNNVAESKSFSNMDIPHVVNILSTFDLPFGKGKKYLNVTNKIGNALASGWTVSSAQVYRAGTLINLQTPGNPLGNGVLFAAATKANLTGVPILTNVERTSLDPNNPTSRYFNAGAFSAAPAYTLGTAAFYQNDFRNPIVFSENLSIVKRTKLFENDKNPVVLTYRADGFNIFNRTNFGGVVGTIGNANFGRPTGPQNGARIITMGLRLEF